MIFTALSVTLVLLIAVFFLDRSHATHRWIRLGPLSLQPSELAKLAVIFYLAWFLEIRTRPRPGGSSGGNPVGINDLLHSLAPALGTLLLVVGLVVAEPDMGTACMISLIAFVMLFVAGLSLRYVAGAIARGDAHRLSADRARALSSAARADVFFARVRPAGPRLPVAAIADRGRLGRLHRRGPDGKPSEAVLFAGGAHGFHFRRDLRGAGLHRRGDRAGAFCRVRLARLRPPP